MAVMNPTPIHMSDSCAAETITATAGHSEPPSSSIGSEWGTISTVQRRSLKYEDRDTRLMRNSPSPTVKIKALVE